MPYKTDFPVLPYLDPEFNPDHPLNHLPPIEEDPYLPLGKRQKLRLQQELEAKAMESFKPPHVVRSWEVDVHRGKRHDDILSMILLPKSPSNIDDLTSSNQIGELIVEHDFRRFANNALHLGYNRFHATQGEPHFESEETEEVPERDICWLMEYTLNECNQIRRKIAKAMGLFPAATDPDTSAYDDEIAWRYERRLYARCRRRNKFCIRPAHIEIFTSTGDTLP